MELPAALTIAVCFAVRSAEHAVPWMMLALWEIHYVHRSLVFPFRMRGGAQADADRDRGDGGVLQRRQRLPQRSLAHRVRRATTRAGSSIRDSSSASTMMASGFAINLRADATLRALRAPGETGYKIPTGGLYRYISCPNYFGEIIEWTGWAVLTWSLAGASFAVWTAANLAPRAWTHHRLVPHAVRRLSRIAARADSVRVLASTAGASCGSS